MRKHTVDMLNCLTDPLLMNAFNNVNMAAVAIVTSVAMAKKLKVPKSRFIYCLGGAGTSDSDDCNVKLILVQDACTDGETVWERPNFFQAPSISQSLGAALAASNVKKTDVDLFDFYSSVKCCHAKYSH